MKAYYMTVTAYDDSSGRDVSTREIDLTSYHTTSDGAVEELHRKYGKHITPGELSERLKADVPSELLGKPNKLQLRHIEIMED